MFRIWHQGFVDFDAVPIYRASFEVHIAQILPLDTTVRLHGLMPGTFRSAVTPIDALRFPAVEALLEDQIIASAELAASEGFDAVAINCFYDPGVRIARSLVDIPVVGLFESCVLTAMSVGATFGLLALNDDQCRKHHELVTTYGLSTRFAGTRAVSPALNEAMLEAEGEDAASVVAGIERACGDLARAGAEVIIPGDGVMNDFIWRHGVAPSGLVIMDAAAVLMHHARYLGQLRQTTGLVVSRSGHYARPPREMLDHSRRLVAVRPAAEHHYSGTGWVVSNDKCKKEDKNEI